MLGSQLNSRTGYKISNIKMLVSELLTASGGKTTAAENAPQSLSRVPITIPLQTCLPLKCLYSFHVQSHPLQVLLLEVRKKAIKSNQILIKYPGEVAQHRG